MTLRTIGSPYDLLTNTEIQAEIGTYKGVAWANMSSTKQTVYQRIIDASADYISKRFRHEPWALHEVSLSLASGTATLQLDNAVRDVDTIVEVYANATRVVTPTTKREWFRAWGTGGQTSHPWNSQTEARWFLDGMSDDNPPKLQLKRVPTPDAAITGTALCHPYLTLRQTGGAADKEYTHIPATAQTAMMDYIFEKISKFDREFQESAVHKQSLEDEMAVTKMADQNEGGWADAARLTEPSDTFYGEMAGP